MIHFDDNAVRDVLLEGRFGLERESLRLTEDGMLSQTKHPFPGDPAIVRDFCENQTEINTTTHDSLQGALEELRQIDCRLRMTLEGLPRREILWPFSNPPVIRSEEDIPIAQFYGEEAGKTRYREYLSEKYGRTIMTYCGVHFNFSFSEVLLARDRLVSNCRNPVEHKNRIYLDLAQNLLEYGWLLVALTAASPLMDRSFYDLRYPGQTVFTGMGSCRCSETGYWNDFVPTMDYSSLDAYGESILQYVRKGWLYSPAELYYPIRLKSYGQNDLHVLMEKGVSHIELRMIDLNPFLPWGVDERDLQFAHLMMVWLSCLEAEPMNDRQQIRAAANFKKAAHYDLHRTRYRDRQERSVPMDEAGLAILRQMKEFYRDGPDWTNEILAYQTEKLKRPSSRYAAEVAQWFGDDYTGCGLSYAKERQQLLCANCSAQAV